MNKPTPTGASPDKRWYGYARVSTSEQADEGTSLESQCKRIKDSIEAEPAKCIEVVVEAGRSGGDIEGRPELRRLRDAIRFGQVDVVVVTSLDRLSRSIKDILELLDEFEKYGVAFRSLRESFDTSTPMGKGMLHIAGVMAEIERGLIAERTTNGRRDTVRQGKWPSGKPIFGLRRVGSRDLPVEKSQSGNVGQLESYEPEVQLVKIIFDLYDDGLSVRGVAEWLAENGHTGWHESKVDRVLRFPFAGGEYPGYPTIKVPQMVKRELWKRVQKQLDASTREKTAPKTRTPLQARVECWEGCGGTWRIRVARPTKGQAARMFCTHRERPRPGSKRDCKKCIVSTQPVDVLEGTILEALKANFTDYDEHIKLLKSCYSSLRGRQREIRRGMPGIVNRLRDLEAQRDRVKHMYEKGALSYQEFDEKIDHLQAKIQVARNSMPDLTEREHELESLRVYRKQLHRRIRAVKYRKEHLIPLHASPADSDKVLFNLKTWYVSTQEDEEVLFSEFYPFSDAAYSEREQLAAMIERFDLRVVMHPDHAELTGMLPMEITLPKGEKESPHASHAARGSG